MPNLLWAIAISPTIVWRMNGCMQFIPPFMPAVEYRLCPMIAIESEFVDRNCLSTHSTLKRLHTLELAQQLIRVHISNKSSVFNYLEVSLHRSIASNQSRSFRSSKRWCEKRGGKQPNLCWRAVKQSTASGAIWPGWALSVKTMPNIPHIVVECPVECNCMRHVESCAGKLIIVSNLIACLSWNF